MTRGKRFDLVRGTSNYGHFARAVAKVYRITSLSTFQLEFIFQGSHYFESIASRPICQIMQTAGESRCWMDGDGLQPFGECLYPSQEMKWQGRGLHSTQNCDFTHSLLFWLFREDRSFQFSLGELRIRG